MIVRDMRRLFPFALVVLAASCRPATPPATQPTPLPSAAPSTASTAAPTGPTARPAPTNDRLALPGGFESTVFHDGVGRARHLAVTADGIVYVKLRGQVQGQPPAGFKGVVALRDTGGDGRADQVEYFGGYEDVGDYGTAMRVYEGHIYFTTAGEVYRQKLVPGQLVPDTPVELVLKHNYRQPGRSYEHIAKPITFDDKGHLYVPFGAPGDVCQDRNRQPGAPGRDAVRPTRMAQRRLAVRRPEARSDREGRHPLRDRHPQPGGHDLEPGRPRALRRAARPRRFVSLVAAVLLALAERDAAVGGVLPGDTKDFDGGWPYYYFDWMLGKKLLNPEYGGDGKKEGDGAKLTPPLVGFPGHFAPNDLLFYQGTQFPERYRHGAFIAFHGSTIRMPYSQAGYFVAFVPMQDGKASGEWEVFADGFAGIDPNPEHRRCPRPADGPRRRARTARSTSATASRAGSGR